MHIESRDLISVLRKYLSKQNTTIIIFNDEFSQYITLFFLSCIYFYQFTVTFD